MSQIGINIKRDPKQKLAIVQYTNKSRQPYGEGETIGYRHIKQIVWASKTIALSDATCMKL